MRPLRLLAMFGVLILLSPAPSGGADLDRDWPQWRGPEASGTQPNARPPVRWSETENVRWKIAVPGIGSSTPIVLGDRVYVSTAVKTDRTAGGVNAGAESDDRAEAAQNSDGERRGGGRFGGGRFGGGAPPTNIHAFLVIAYDRADGREVWRTTLTEQVPHESGHSTNTFASSSPITDGERLFVSFGSYGIFCLDLDGKPQWERDLGQMQTRNQFGEGSSPALHGNTLVVPWDHEGQSFIVALDATTGDPIWKVDRDERTTWATPLITEYQGRTQVIVNGSRRVCSYDLKTGELIWECGGQAGNPIPSPVRYGDDVIVMTGFRGYAIYSIPLSARGDVTDTDTINWFVEDAAPYVPSPVLYDGQLYFVKSNNGVLLSRSAADGDLVIDQTRLPEISSVYASPVAAAGHVYITGRDGTTVVLKHGADFEVVATNRLDAEIDASAALVDNEIFLRGKQELYCIAE